MYHQPSEICFRLPQWLQAYSSQYQPTPGDRQKMRFVVGAARENTIQKTGGPFGAGIFNIETGELIALGVNLVTSENLSLLHAEMVAMAIAQRKFNQYNFSTANLPALELVTSTEPCAMCLGGIHWSGLKRVVSGARGVDAEAIGFDEGPKPPNWQTALEQRGIIVKTEVELAFAQGVLQFYQAQQGPIYNA
ncbi:MULTISPECIES: nucleoside deaminase [Cyanophyceae]|uniref:nucleoside deaminase n=1 Tax=Cyanophyceae TaxID=3028117 RepID=UPI0008103DE2|nr:MULTISPECIES: nucleoside deaminase [Cyanophyceae]ANV92108.1 tRNA-specific adenosine deaminase [Picosynechococcus sp. PCC 8807]